MKKYNKKEIMKRAWRMVKTNNFEIRKALKVSWAMEKKAVALKKEWYREDGTVSFRFWRNYGKVRAYYTCSWFSKYANGKKNNFIDLACCFE